MQRKEKSMEQEKQKHYYLQAQHHYLDIQANDLETGISFYMYRIKEGLYLFIMDQTPYLLNTEKDISFTSDYSFQVGEYIFTLVPPVKEKQLCLTKTK